MTGLSRRIGRAIPALALLVGCAAEQTRPALLPPQARYVAMGSSFAAGPGVTQSADTPKTRCRRSMDNYAHQLARRRNLALVDVSCGGATSQHLLGAWGELAPQIDALTDDTRLVTVTIGGNDVGYIAVLLAASCSGATTGRVCPAFPRADEATWAALSARLDAFAGAVTVRAPNARLIFVNYVTILPGRGTCAATPLKPADGEAIRALARRLAVLTAAVAKRHGAGLLDAATLSRRHDACGKEPWVNGYPRSGQSIVPYHPTLSGMTAIAVALDQQLDGKRS